MPQRPRTARGRARPDERGACFLLGRSRSVSSCGVSAPSAGNLGQGVTPRLLRDLYVQRRTGLLQFSRGDDTCSVCFIKGHIAWGQSSLAECRLGPVLVRNFLLTQEMLDRVFDKVGTGKRLGDVLLETGALDQQTLD